MASSAPSPDALRDEILRQVEDRGPGASICPSEVARALAEEWRPLLPRVREAACTLARAGRIDILRKGRPIEPNGIRGVIRLRIGRGSSGCGGEGQGSALDPLKAEP